MSAPVVEPTGPGPSYDGTAPLSSTADGRPVPPATERARRPLPPDRLAGWLTAIGLAALALLLRLWRLDSPRDFAFDETYYAKDAWSLLHHGYVTEYVEDAEDLLVDGTTSGLFTDEPSMVVHPEVGKWMIAAGEHVFGMDAFGWRVSSAVVGALMVLVVVRLARRLTGSTLLGGLAGLLLCLDGLHLVMSRLALLDVFMVFWLVCGVAAIVADRDHTRARMAGIVESGRRPRLGPLQPLWFRPWLLAAGACFGLAVGTKWNALYPLAAFGLLVWAWDAGAQRSFGVRWATLKTAVVGGAPAFVHLVLVALVVYTASWTGWLVHAQEYEQTYSLTQYTERASGERWPTAEEPDASGAGEVWQSLRSLGHYHRDLLAFHTHFLDDSDHTYASDPLGWLVLSRPVGVNAELDIPPGTQGCTAPAGSDCLRQVVLLGTPVLWWVGAAALLYAVVAWVARRDWRFGVPVVGTASTWLPWFAHADRPIFSFYAIAVLPFTVLALTLVAGRLLGPDRRPSPRRTAGVVAVGTFVVLVVLNFAWFWPVWTNELLTHSEWLLRMWFDRWI